MYVRARAEQRAKRSAYISQLWQLPAAAAEKVAATGEAGGGGVASRQWGGSVRQPASSLWCHSGASLAEEIVELLLLLLLLSLLQLPLLLLLLLLVLLLAFESRGCASIAFEVVFVISSNIIAGEMKRKHNNLGSSRGARPFLKLNIYLTVYYCRSSNINSVN